MQHEKAATLVYKGSSCNNFIYFIGLLDRDMFRNYVGRFLCGIRHGFNYIVCAVHGFLENDRFSCPAFPIWLVGAVPSRLRSEAPIQIEGFYGVSYRLG